MNLLKELKIKLETIEEIEQFLMQLHWHHNAQTKPQRNLASIQYNKELSDKALKLARKIKDF